MAGREMGPCTTKVCVVKPSFTTSDMMSRKKKKRYDCVVF